VGSVEHLAFFLLIVQHEIVGVDDLPVASPRQLVSLTAGEFARGVASTLTLLLGAFYGR